MSAGSFGHLFADSNTTADRIKYTVPIGPITLLAIYQKSAEADKGTTTADSDYDVYYLAPLFKSENINGGILYGYYVDKRNSDLTPAATQYESTFHLFDPYITAKFGGLKIDAEIQYLTGDAKDFTETGGATDIDKSELAYWFEASYNFGAFSVMGGYAFTSGDANGTTDNEDSAHSGFGNDWEKLYILAGNQGTIDTTLGMGGTAPKGNFSADGVAADALNYGCSVVYIGGGFAINDQLKLDAIIGYAQADEVPTAWDDSIGTEIDLKLTYKIMDNLTYTIVGAYLDAGDYWFGGTNGVEPANFQSSTSAIFHNLQIKF
jgi:hypothetical protein